MSDRSSKDKNVRKLIRWGKISLGLTLPADILFDLKWKEKQKVIVTKHRGGILIKDWHKVSKPLRDGGRK
jgi:hypothetical protein